MRVEELILVPARRPGNRQVGLCSAWTLGSSGPKSGFSIVATNEFQSSQQTNFSRRNKHRYSPANIESTSARFA